MRSTGHCVATILIPVILATVPMAGGADNLVLVGDANLDGRVSLADPGSMLAYLGLGCKAPPCARAADVNANGQLDLSDAVLIYQHLFLGGDCPPAPFPGCGSDPTPDSLECTEIRFDCP